MGDLRTELFVKVLPKMNEVQSLDNLKFDDDVEGATTKVVETTATATTKPNISQQIWEYIQAHPNSSSMAVAKGTGLVRDDVNTRLAQLFKRGYLKRTQGIDGLWSYTTFHDKYPARAYPSILAAAQEARRRNAAARREEKAKSASRKETTTSSSLPTVDLSKMTVFEARALYEELKKIFGG